MIQLKSVKGTQLYVPKVEINVDTVYLRENIKEKYDEENNRYWEYDETQLSIPEYFKNIIPENEKAIGELSLLFSLYQSQVDQALAELSILIGEMKNEDSGLVKIWVRLLTSENNPYTIYDIPDIGNLKNIVLSLIGNE